MDHELKPGRNRVFFVASLTKAITAAAIGILVDDGLLGWTTPVHDMLPELSRPSLLSDAKLNLLDILSHRTGVAWVRLFGHFSASHSRPCLKAQGRLRE